MTGCIKKPKYKAINHDFVLADLMYWIELPSSKLDNKIKIGPEKRASQATIDNGLNS